jgi:glycosyltransferase involved in cell wall biosynthesis
MAQAEVTGYTVQELAELRHEYLQTPKAEKGIPFETAYCLTRIGKQPEDYDGPTRYCSNRVARLDDGGHAHSCRFHGANQNADGNNDNLELLAALKHGMYATDEHLKEVFDEDDQKLYDFIMSWADAYGWPSKEEDPARYDLLEQAALGRVRVARSSKYILDEGEMDRQEVYDENGNLRVITDAHGLSEDLRLKQKLILDIMKELGLTPKEASKMNTDEKTASATEQLAAVAAEAVLGGGEDGEEPSFDPDDEIFEDEDG